VTFKRIYLFDINTNCLRVQTKLIISRAGCEDPLDFVPIDLKKEPSCEDGNANLEVWTIENPMLLDVVDLLFSFYWNFDNTCFIIQFPLQCNHKRSWVFSDNTDVFSPTVTEPDEVSALSDDEDSSQLREERRIKRLKAQ
jgi:hypothetical protein